MGQVKGCTSDSQANSRPRNRFVCRRRLHVISMHKTVAYNSRFGSILSVDQRNYRCKPPTSLYRDQQSRWNYASRIERVSRPRNTLDFTCWPLLRIVLDTRNDRACTCHCKTPLFLECVNFERSYPKIDDTNFSFSFSSVYNHAVTN